MRAGPAEVVEAAVGLNMVHDLLKVMTMSFR